MGRFLVRGSDVAGAANPGFRLTLAFAPGGKFSRGRAARLVRQSPMKSIAAISSDGASERFGSDSSAIQRSRSSSEKLQ